MQVTSLRVTGSGRPYCWYVKTGVSNELARHATDVKCNRFGTGGCGCLTTQHGAARANSVRDLSCEVRTAFELMAVARDELAVMTVMCASGSANRNLPSRKFAQSNLHPPTQILVVAKPETFHRDQKVALRCTANPGSVYLRDKNLVPSASERR